MGFSALILPPPSVGEGRVLIPLALAAGVAVPYYRGPRAAPYLTGWGLMVLLGSSGGVGRFVATQLGNCSEQCIQPN
jgi:hypothetical protein